MSHDPERQINPREHSGPVRVILTGKARATLDFDFNPSDETIRAAAADAEWTVDEWEVDEIEEARDASER